MSSTSVTPMGRRPQRDATSTGVVGDQQAGVDRLVVRLDGGGVAPRWPGEAVARTGRGGPKTM